MRSSSGNWFVRHKILTSIIILIIIGIGFGVATNSSGNTNVNNASANTANVASRGPGSKSTNSTAHVGSTINIGGSKGLAVTLQQVIDPAQGADQFTTPDAGNRFVAAKFQIVNNGTAAFSDDANGDVTLIGSDNQSYTADFSDIAGCTNFSSGQFTLASGASATGCVNFQLPNAVKASKVQFQPNSGFSNNTGEWLVP